MKIFKSIAFYLGSLPLLFMMLGLLGCQEKEPNAKPASSTTSELLSSHYVPLNFELTLDLSTLEALKQGFSPRDMNDKWMITYQDDALSFYRSWTGYLIYQCDVRVAQQHVLISNCVANRNPDQVKLMSEENMHAFDIKQLNGLISMLIDKKL